MVNLLMPMVLISILLIIILVVLLIVWILKPKTPTNSQRRARSDLKRIKERIIDEDEI